MGSLWASTILIILCLAPELKATPCCDGVYLGKRIISFLHMELEICYECNIKTQNISKSINYIFYVYFQNIYFQIIAYTSSSFLITQKICDFYLIYWAGACFSAARTGRAADILVETSFSRACLVFSVVSITASSSGICMSGSSSSICLGTKS